MGSELSARTLADLDVHPGGAMQTRRRARFSLTTEISTLVSPDAARDALRNLGDEHDKRHLDGLDRPSLLY